MYTRLFSETPDKIIQNGAPVFGTFKVPFKQLDIRNISRPFGDLPIPHWITNLRIRAHLFCPFVTEEYAGIIDIFDSTIFALVETIIWDRKTGKKFPYRRVLCMHKRLVPKSIEQSVCISFSERRYIRINWSSAAKRISVFINLKGDNTRPSIAAAFNVDCSQKDFAEIASVTPAQINRRCAASALKTGSLTGSIVFTGTQQGTYGSKGLMTLELRRAYYPLRTKANALYGLGVFEGKKISFKICSSNLDGNDTYHYNENVLFIDGESTLLPPVKITRPKGILGPWVIQDTESMVDLIFYPESDSHRTLSLLILHANYHTLYGNFEGTLLTNKGESISLKDFSGIGKKIQLRY